VRLYWQAEFGASLTSLSTHPDDHYSRGNSVSTFQTGHLRGKARTSWPEIDHQRNSRSVRNSPWDPDKQGKPESRHLSQPQSPSRSGRGSHHADQHHPITGASDTHQHDSWDNRCIATESFMHWMLCSCICQKLLTNYFPNGRPR